MSTTLIRGTTATISLELRNRKGELANAEGALSLVVIDPAGGENTYTYAKAEITKDSTGLYHHDVGTPLSGLWHYRWLDAGQVADEDTFEVESDFDVETDEGAEEPDLTDLMLLVPRARRKIEGPWGNPNGRPPLTNTQVYEMVADACGEVVMLSGSFFHHTLKVKARDPLIGFPTRWQTDSPLTEYESAIICAQVALNYYFHVFNNMKISETIQNEGTMWTWELSASVIRSYLQAVVEERDKAIEGLRINVPVLDRYASNIRVRDQATVAVLEWWSGEVGAPLGLPGGQEAAVVPILYPPGSEGP